MAEERTNQLVAVVGAGPAGLFATRELAANGVQVVLLNRDIKPGGLAEYGIYPDKYKMKEGLRGQFWPIVSFPNVHYYGNVRIGNHADLSLDELRMMGFQSILVTVGAQGTKWLGLPGETLRGVYHAKDIVYHYNRLPPYSTREFNIGKRVVLVGAGNVMIDIAHWLISDRHVQEVTALARRGPAEVKFDKRELELVVANLDMSALNSEIERVAPTMRAIGQDPHAPKALIIASLPKAAPTGSDSHFTLHFLASPRQIVGDEQGNVTGLEVEENTLVVENGEVKAVGTGNIHTLEADTVIFAIGDRVDEDLGLPVRGGKYVIEQNPRFPQDGESYEVCEPKDEVCRFEGIFVAGWARKASTGLVGVARKDGVNGARAVLQYLAGLPPAEEDPLEQVKYRLHSLCHPVITQDELNLLLAAEQKYGREHGIEYFKFSTNEDMLEAIFGRPG